MVGLLDGHGACVSGLFCLACVMRAHHYHETLLFTNLIITMIIFILSILLFVLAFWFFFI